jgi:pyruvate kinase
MPTERQPPDGRERGENDDDQSGHQRAGGRRGLSATGTMRLREHKAKITATIGPASAAPAMMQYMVRAGMDIARLNFSHGSFDDHGRNIENLRAAARAAGRDVAILADLPGPKIRLGTIAGEPVELAVGQPFTLTTEEVTGGPTRAFVSFPELPRVVTPGNHLFLNDGLVDLEVEAVAGSEVRCRVVAGGEIRSRKGVNLPGVDLGIPAFTDHDRRCLEFALRHGVDAVSQSFVESAADVERVRDAARALGYEPFLIAKIERARALDRVDEILAAADGLMIARGDLGVEVPIEQMAVLQKTLMRKAIRAGKPVITATQMLESMTSSRQPTRAEATDVANAILDGTDCVMLSAESASGLYPVEAIATLARIAAATEPHRSRFELWDRMRTLTQEVRPDLYDLAAVAAEAVMEFGKSACVVVPTGGGRTARTIARFRLPVWIAAVTPSEPIARHLHFSYGVHPVRQDGPVTDWNAFTREWVALHGLSGSMAVLLRGPLPDRPSANHAVELIDLGTPTREAIGR